jgi:SPP1 family predicted phage head-tail adaptor
MGAVGPKTAIADRPHRVTFQNPGPNVPDGDGGYTNSWTDLVPPALSVKIAPATQRDLERVIAGTVMSTATHIVTGPFHPQVTTKTRVLFDGRQFSVVGVADPEEGQVEMILVCVEVVA